MATGLDREFQLPRSGPPPRSVSRFVCDTLRGAILDGTLRGGTRLVIATLAQQLQVSSTPLRDALHDLAHEGLVVLDARRGAVVRNVDYTEVVDIYEIREVIEPLVTSRAARKISGEELRELEDLQRRMSEESEFGRWNQLNDRFHTLIAQAAKWDDSLEDLTRSLVARCALHVSVAADIETTGAGLEFWQHEITRSHTEHQSIIDACAAQDPERAAAAMKEHIQATFENIRRFHHEMEIADESL